MNIVVSGSEGFIGKKLIQKLRVSDINTTGVDKKIGFDITNFDNFLKLSDFDIFIHLASKIFIPDSFKDPYGFYHTNILGTLNSLEICRIRKAKMIFISSYIYGNPVYLPINEKHPVDSHSPYSLSKIIGEQLCKNYAKDFNIPVIIIRPFNCFGPGQSRNFLIPTIIEQAKTGKITLKDPIPKRDYIYVDDLTDLIIKTLKYNRNNFEIFNAAYGKSTSVVEVVETIVNAYNKHIKFNFTNQKRTNEVYDIVGDISKAESFLNWKPKIDFIKGIKLILDSKKN